MRGQISFALIFFLLLCVHSRAQTACVDAAQLAHSTIGITRYFDDVERTAQSNLAGIQGTGWFQSPTTVVTVGHVATDARLPVDHGSSAGADHAA
jgi:hypothetical protein